jgi:acyl carrier protein
MWRSRKAAACWPRDRGKAARGDVGRSVPTAVAPEMLIEFSTNIDVFEEETTMSTVQQRVIDVTARVLHLDPAQIAMEHTFTTDLGAESVQSVELVAMFEEEFGIEMDEDEALSVTTVGDAVRYITQVCKEQGVEC